MTKHHGRLSTYGTISTALSCLSDERLAELLDNSTHVYSGIGGQAVVLNLADTQIFVKKVPLTDLERRPENIMSTANLFELPLSCHYGVFSVPTPGFGVWRELASHIMTTNWVISGECLSFPLLYHWRILSSAKPQPMSEAQLTTLDEDVNFWNNSAAVRNRLERAHNASAHVLLFLEHIPLNLDHWLRSELSKDDDAASIAVTFVEEKIHAVNQFLKAQGFIHFDAHFRNILTDGHEIYFSDFGLSVSSKFDLSDAERQFQKEHHSYDQCGTLKNLLHCIIESYFGKGDFEANLRRYLNGELGKLPPAVSKVVRRYAELALTIADFYQKLETVSKTTPFPADHMETLLSAANPLRRFK